MLAHATHMAHGTGHVLGQGHGGEDQEMSGNSAALYTGRPPG